MDRIDGLAPRESQIALLVTRGLQNKEIAHQLNLTRDTIAAMLNRVMTKMHVNNRTELAAKIIGADRDMWKMRALEAEEKLALLAMRVTDREGD